MEPKVLTENPLQQGLKQYTTSNYETIYQLVLTENPLQQGLKPLSGFDVICFAIVLTENPLQQGLKLNECPTTIPIVSES